MTNKYYSVMTNSGINYINTQILSGEEKLITNDWYIALGTGELEPTNETTSLKNKIFDKNSEFYGGISFGYDETGGHYAEMLLPESLKGKIITEAGLYNSQNTLIAVAKTHIDLTEASNGLELAVRQRIYISAVPASVQIIYTPHADLISKDDLDLALEFKQDNLTAGDNVVINNNIISANLNAKYCVNSGNTNSTGEADLIDAVATTVITDSTETTQTVTKTVNPQYTTPGTYTFNAPVDGYYLVDVVGGGGNGIQHVNQYFVYAHGGGGSGAGFRGELYLSAGNHTITVGGACGGSSIDNLIIAGGGGSASMNNTVNATAGSGGVLTVTGQTQNVQVQANGNAGAIATASVAAGGASVYCGWGAGGASNGSPATGVVTLYRQWQETITTGGTTETVIAGSSEVNYKIGGNYRSITATDLKGHQFAVTGLNTDYVNTLADGTYHKFVGADGSSELIKNKIYRQALSPAANLGDVWINTSLEPVVALKNNGSSWESYDKIPLGEIIVSNGVVSSFKTFPYNQNGYNANMRSPLGKPSGKITDLPTTASGGAVTAPYNGYVQLAALACNSIQIYNNSRTGFWNAVANQAGNAASVCVPCQKGDVIQIYYDISTPRWFRCYADEGAI